MLSTNPINEDAPSDCSSTAKRTLIERCIQVSKGREMEDESYSSGAFSGTDSYAPCRHDASQGSHVERMPLSSGIFAEGIHDHVDKSHGRDLSGSACVAHSSVLHLVTPSQSTGSQIAPQVLRSRSRWSILFEPHSQSHKRVQLSSCIFKFLKRWTSYEGNLYSTIWKLTCNDEISWKYCYFDHVISNGFEKKDTEERWMITPVP